MVPWVHVQLLSTVYGRSIEYHRGANNDSQQRLLESQKAPPKMSRSTFGPQPSSKRPSAPVVSFPASTRETASKVYFAQEDAQHGRRVFDHSVPPPPQKDHASVGKVTVPTQPYLLCFCRAAAFDRVAALRCSACTEVPVLPRLCFYACADMHLLPLLLCPRCRRHTPPKVTFYNATQLEQTDRTALRRRAQMLQDALGRENLTSLPHNLREMVQWILQAQVALSQSSGRPMTMADFGASAPSAEERGESYFGGAADKWLKNPEAGKRVMLTLILNSFRTRLCMRLQS